MRKVHDEQHDFQLVEPNYDFGTIIVRKDGQYLGAGYLRPMLEAVMVLDLNASLRDKSIALRKMINQAIIDTRSLNVDEFRAWTKNPDFTQRLVHHYNFERLEGESLRLRV